MINGIKKPSGEAAPWPAHASASHLIKLICREIDVFHDVVEHFLGANLDAAQLAVLKNQLADVGVVERGGRGGGRGGGRCGGGGARSRRHGLGALAARVRGGMAWGHSRRASPAAFGCGWRAKQRNPRRAAAADMATSKATDRASGGSCRTGSRGRAGRKF